MKVLFVCSAGMSSMIAVNALKKAGEDAGIALEVNAVGSPAFDQEIQKGYDVVMVAPQIRHRFKELKDVCDQFGIPCEKIEPMAYTPLGGPKLLQQLLNVTKK